MPGVVEQQQVLGLPGGLFDQVADLVDARVRRRTPTVAGRETTHLRIGEHREQVRQVAGDLGYVRQILVVVLRRADQNDARALLIDRAHSHSGSSSTLRTRASASRARLTSISTRRPSGLETTIRTSA